jgi:hypothetical protein
VLEIFITVGFLCLVTGSREVFMCMCFQDDSNLRSNNIAKCGARLGRVVKIMKTLVQQFDILETMEAQSFLDFRECLVLNRAVRAPADSRIPQAIFWRPHLGFRASSSA